MNTTRVAAITFAALAAALASVPVQAQVPPTAAEAAAHHGLHAAAHRGDLSAIQRLVTEKAALEARDRAGRTPLHVATFARQHEAVRVLLQAGAPLDHVNKLHWTALIEAIVLGDGGVRHQATLKALLDAGASTQLTDRSGATPLQLARARGYAAMVQMLQAAGAR